MPYEPKVNDYVTYGDDKKYGKVRTVDAGGGTVVVVDTAGKDQSVSIDTVKLSRMARIVVKAAPNFREVVENVAFMSAYNPLIAGKGILSNENVSFLIAEIIHEFVLKGIFASFIDMLGDTTLTSAEDKEAWFQTADFTDAARKIPFVFGLTQLTQKFLFKKPLNHAIMHNLLGGFSSMVVSNVADRMYYSEEDKYSYP